MIKRLFSSFYEKPLEKLGILALEDRRLRKGMVALCKYLKGYPKYNGKTWFSLSPRTGSKADLAQSSREISQVSEQNNRTSYQRKSGLGLP